MSGSLPCFLHISASRDVGQLRITLLIFLCHSINTLMPSNLMTLVEESYRIEMTRSALERSSLHRGWNRDLCGRDFRWWLLRQIELEATEKEFQVRFGLGVAGQEQLAAIAGGDLDVD